jgi:hypothetical protein
MLCGVEPGAKCGDYPIRLLEELSPADPDHVPAGELEIEVAAVVALEGNLCGVGAPAVRLSYHSSLRPVKVDFVSGHHGVHCRPREAGFSYEVQKAALELVAGGRRLVVEVAQQATQSARAPAALGTGKRVVQGAEIKQPQDLRLLESPFEAPWRDYCGQIHERSGPAGARHAVPHRYVGRRQRTSEMDRDSGPPGGSTPRHSHIDRPNGRRKQVEKSTGRAMARNRAVPARENGGNEVALYGQPVANRIDAHVYSAEPPDLDSPLNLVTACPQGKQLLAAHHTVLPSSQLGDTCVQVLGRRLRGRWHGFYVLYPQNPCHRRSVARFVLREGDGCD